MKNSFVIHPCKRKFFRDYIFRFFLKLFWEPFSKKKSHFWDWNVIPDGTEIKQYIHVKGDKKEISGKSFWGDFLGKNFTWKNVIIVGLAPNVSALSNIDKLFQIGFRTKNGRKEVCNLIFSDRVGMLIGDEDVDFFALSFPFKINIPLVKLGETKRYSAKIPII